MSTPNVNPILEAQVDLSKEFKEFMHVGFSASNGNGLAIHTRIGSHEAMNINSLQNQEQSLQEIHSHQNSQPQMSSHFDLTTSHDDFLEQMILTQLELGSLLRSLGLKPSSDQLDSLIQKADKNNNGLVEFSEFVELVAPKLLPTKLSYTKEQLRQLFRMFDRDGNMYITAA
ncbi:putative calcium-binding protein cml18 [Forsythia ovata]|uniref:Calcium-binding protein cml18 n=1 Tax=Forsythia ovata TaxID=205694 RepID=A0ABD1UX08_9LAMI